MRGRQVQGTQYSNFTDKVLQPCQISPEQKQVELSIACWQKVENRPVNCWILLTAQDCTHLLWRRPSYFLFLCIVGEGGATPDWLEMECWGDGGTRELADGDDEGRRPPPSPAVTDTSSYVSCSSSLHKKYMHACKFGELTVEILSCLPTTPLFIKVVLHVYIRITTHGPWSSLYQERTTIKGKGGGGGAWSTHTYDLHVHVITLRITYTYYMCF